MDDVADGGLVVQRTVILDRRRRRFWRGNSKLDLGLGELLVHLLGKDRKDRGPE